ncbi:MAG: ABC transporter ATP-binding protein [bacterium]
MDIEIQDLTKTYITTTALRNVSLNVARGESVGLVGSNGAGKTTLLHILMGFIPFDEGIVNILDAPSANLGAPTKERIGFVAEQSSLLPWATLLDMAGLYENLYSRWDDDMLSRFIDEWEIVADKRMRTMSKGQKRLAELALCFSCHPEILLLDEPFIGLDAVMRFRVLDVMKEMHSQDGTTIFYSSHILSDIEKIAHRVIIIREGEICLDEQISHLKSSVEELFVKHYGLSTEERPLLGE